MAVDMMRTVAVAVAVAMVASCGGIGEVVPAAEENVLAGSEEGEGIEQLFVVHEGVPLGSKVAFPLQPILVARQVLLAAERFADAHDVCVVLHKGGQAGPSGWQLVAKEGHDVEDLLVRYCNGESMVPPGSEEGKPHASTHTHTYQYHQFRLHLQVTPSILDWRERETHINTYTLTHTHTHTSSSPSISGSTYKHQAFNPF
jgi:hypothetical protein